MALQLIKKTGEKCKCGCDEYIRQGNGWTCTECFLYKPSDFENLKDGLSRLVKYVKENK